MRTAATLLLFLLLSATPLRAEGPFVVVLGVAQDGGHPQAGCERICCTRARVEESMAHRVSCLGLVAPASGRRWLLDATPDLPRQVALFDQVHPVARPADARDLGLDGIFLTHAHMGHYAGLLHLGREAAGTRRVPVYAMPRMASFLESNGPWSQLVELENVVLFRLEPDHPVDLGDGLRVTPLPVPHRDEYSETVGFVVEGPGASVLYLPDIDKWERWDRSLEEVLASVDRAYLDGTFFRNGEIPGRDMSEIPHPFVEETLARLAADDSALRSKVRFLHLNHTNPALDPASEAGLRIREAGCGVAVEGERFGI